MLGFQEGAFSQTGIERVPEREGVYFLYNDDRLIYIGRSSNLNYRLGRHLRGVEGPCTQSATSYRYELTGDSVGREIELHTTYKEGHGGRLPPCNDRVG